MAIKKKKYIPKTKKEVLAELKTIDSFGLLDVKAKEKRQTSDDILLASFLEINDFIDENKRLPDEKMSAFEFILHSRLLEIRLSDEKMRTLKPHDCHGLFSGLMEGHSSNLDSVKAEEDVGVNNRLGLEDAFGLLSTPKNSIFNLKNVKSHQEKVTTMPEVVAKRKKCKDFEVYEPLFFKCQQEIENGDRTMVAFRNEQDIKVGSFFVYGGLKCLVASVGEKTNNKGKVNARLRLIFENGLESNMLLRSLSAELYKDGRRILESRNKSPEEISEDDTTGFIYVLRSLSEDPQIKSLKNLYKIGFSTTPVEERIKNAEKEATYLMAKVKIISTYRVGGIKPIYFETLIHRLFDHVKLDIEVIDLKGRVRKPEEWFFVPYDVIEDTIALISSGEIIEYVYDAQNMKLIKNKPTP